MKRVKKAQESKKVPDLNSGNKDKNDIPVVIVINKSGKLGPELLGMIESLCADGVSVFLINTHRLNYYQVRSLSNLESLVVEIKECSEGRIKDISNQTKKFFEDLKSILRKLEKEQ
jgi:hypothetical protein